LSRVMKQRYLDVTFRKGKPFAATCTCLERRALRQIRSTAVTAFGGVRLAERFERVREAVCKAPSTNPESAAPTPRFGSSSALAGRRAA
jgi:hypothetical protein